MKVTIEFETDDTQQAKIMVNAVDFHWAMFDFGQRFRSVIKHLDPDDPEASKLMQLYQYWFDCTEGMFQE